MELLSPAGGRESMIAAVQNGADAVYLGTRAFNARRGADNFEGEGLSEAVFYCHARGVKVYVTLNTMAREDERSELARTIAEGYESGADAFIVQDLGVAEACRRIAPSMQLHASTQMAVHNRQGVEFLARRGFSRVVLAREMEFSEIRECAGPGRFNRSIRARRSMCVLLRSVPVFLHDRRAQRQPRHVCAALPDELPTGRSGGIPAFDARPDDRGNAGPIPRSGDFEPQDRGAHAPPGVRGGGNLRLPARAGRKPVGAEDIEALGQIYNRGGFTRGYAPGVEERTLLYRERPNHAGVRIGRCERNGEVVLQTVAEVADVLVLRGSGEDVPIKLSGEFGAKRACPEARRGDLLIRLVSERQMRKPGKATRAKTGSFRSPDEWNCTSGSPRG